jgi:hypothetical protein
MACHSPLTALVVIDPVVADTCRNNYQILLQNTLSHAKVLMLDAHSDGVTQITKALANLTDLECLHLVAASFNGLQLGSTKLTLFNLDRYGWQLQQWGNSFTPKAEIRVYGDQAADSSVISSLSTPFLNRLCLLTGAKVTVINHWLEQTGWPNRTIDNGSNSLLMG